MNGLLADLARGFWRLLPANPIFLRVVHGGGRRTRHLWIRAIYLVVILCVAIIGAMVFHSGQSNSLGELSKASSQIFKYVSLFQLALMCFLAPVFTAAAITQERDAETYNILLSTPLSNAQIVLGSLTSRMFFVLALLLAGLPIFCITMLYGGVTMSQILLSFGIAGGTAVLTGSLAIALSVMKVGTRKTIFSFYMMIAAYLMAVWVVGLNWRAPHAPVAVQASFWTGDRMSMLAAFHPFLSLAVALNITPAPAAADVAAFGWPMREFLAYPYQSYIALTLGVSAMVTTVCMVSVRRGAKLGELAWWQKIVEFIAPAKAKPMDGERRRRPRRVWSNPVAWREARTRVSTGGQHLLRWGFIGTGAVAAIVLLYAHVTGAWGLKTSDTGYWLKGLLLLETVGILLVACNAAAGAITREREGATMELLLTTPLTSRYIIWGKLRGLVGFAGPLLAVPVVTALAFALVDLPDTMGSGKTREALVMPEGAFEMAIVMLIYVSLACVLGLHMSLKLKKTTQAVLASVGILMGVGLALFGCVSVMAEASDEIFAFAAPFTPLTGVVVLIDPASQLSRSTVRRLPDMRVMTFVGCLVAAGVYALIAAGLYRSMVRNFDMTVRKQSA